MFLQAADTVSLEDVTLFNSWVIAERITSNDVFTQRTPNVTATVTEMHITNATPSPKNHFTGSSWKSLYLQ